MKNEKIGLLGGFGKINQALIYEIPNGWGFNIMCMFVSRVQDQ